MSYPDEDVNAFEFRMRDPVTDEWFYYTAPSWEEFERILISVSRHRGHPMELWAIQREYADYMEPVTPWMEGGALLLPWKRIARMDDQKTDWARSSMNGPSMGAARARRIKPTQMKLAKADRLAARIEKELKPYADFIMVVGSVRRRVPTVGDIELVVLPKDMEELLGVLAEEGFTGKKRKQIGVVNGMPIEIYIAHEPKELGAMVMWFTGDWQWNVAMNTIAKRRGLKRNQYGIWKGAKPVLQSEDEVDFFDFLDVKYHEPEERSLARRVKPKKASRSAKMGDGSDQFWDGEEE